jgi:hypothetical protein
MVREMERGSEGDGKEMGFVDGTKPGKMAGLHVRGARVVEFAARHSLIAHLGG